MKIHKQRHSHYRTMKFTKCGILARYRDCSYHWKAVNCKRCLKTNSSDNTGYQKDFPNQDEHALNKISKTGGKSLT